MISSYFGLLVVCQVVQAAIASPVLLVSIDGLGWQFTGGKFANTPNLDFIADTGVNALYMKTVTPTSTWPNHQTYVTGLYPESHGIVSNRFWDPLYQEQFIFEYDCSNYDLKFWTEAEPIWLTLQKQGIHTGSHFWPGFSSYSTKPTYYEKAKCLVNCSAIPSKELPLYRNTTRSSWSSYTHCVPNYTEPFQQRIDTIIHWLTSDKPAQFVAFYVDQPDWVGHSDGPQSQKFKEMIEKVDRDVVGYLITQLRKVNLLDKINVVFVADHSFVTVNTSRLIHLDEFLDPSTYRLSDDYKTAVHIWPNEGKLDEVYENLTRLVQRYPQANVYKKQDIPEDYHWKNNRRIPPLYLDPGYGWVTLLTRSNKSQDWVYGAHGYPASKDLAGIFYARGPAFKKGYKVNHGLESIDVYAMLCDILGITPRPNNGSLANMEMMMVTKSTGVSSSMPRSRLLFYVSHLVSFYLIRVTVM